MSGCKENPKSGTWLERNKTKITYPALVAGFLGFLVLMAAGLAPPFDKHDEEANARIAIMDISGGVFYLGASTFLITEFIASRKNQMKKWI